MKQPFNYPQDLITLSFFLHESQNVPHLSCNIQGSCSCSREKKPKQEKETWHEMQQLNETCVKNFPRHKNHPDLTALFLEQLSLLLTMLFPTKIYCFRWQGPPACFFGYFDIFIALDVGGVVGGELQRLPLPILHVQTDRNMASLVVARLPCAQTIACLLGAHRKYACALQSLVMTSIWMILKVTILPSRVSRQSSLYVKEEREKNRRKRVSRKKAGVGIRICINFIAHFHQQAVPQKRIWLPDARQLSRSYNQSFVSAGIHSITPVALTSSLKLWSAGTMLTFMLDWRFLYCCMKTDESNRSNI